ncbi:MAG: hypothetical protein PF445_00860, partial [Melioribacteraceae bacterium]|nr:hypothetical protein [Melioribacteraceae bacterium]
MKTIKNILIKPIILLLIFLGLVSLIVFSAYFELRQSKAEVINLMSEEAHSLLQSIIVSSQEVLYASHEVESEIQGRLLNNANTIKILYDQKIASNFILNQIAFQNEINRIHVINKKGIKVFTSHSDFKPNTLSPQLIKKELEPIFHNETDTLIVGFQNSSADEGMQYVVAIASKNNDAIVLNLDAEELLAFKRRIGFGILIKRLTEDREVQFAILENENGILAASGNIDGIKVLSNIDSEVWAESDSTYKWRIALYDGLEVLEALHPFNLGGNFIGYYRIGLSLEPLEAINERLQRRIIISGIILFVVGFIMISLVFVRRNLDLVKKQYLKIESYSKKLIESVSDAIIVINNNNSIT